MLGLNTQDNTNKRVRGFMPLLLRENYGKKENSKKESGQTE